MLSIFIEHLLRELRRNKEKIVNTLSSNAVKDMEQYRLLNGRLQGLEEGIFLVQETYKSMVETRTIEGMLVEDEKE